VGFQVFAVFALHGDLHIAAHHNEHTISVLDHIAIDINDLAFV